MLAITFGLSPWISQDSRFIWFWWWAVPGSNRRPADQESVV
jgi:hypothetical protein